MDQTDDKIAATKLLRKIYAMLQKMGTGEREGDDYVELKLRIERNPDFMGEAYITGEVNINPDRRNRGGIVSVIIHELLHLLGADDCYDMTKEDWGPNCGLPNCIMQYQATIDNVGDWPFLCEKNIEKIRNRINEWKKEP